MPRFLSLYGVHGEFVIDFKFFLCGYLVPVFFTYFIDHINTYFDTKSKHFSG